MQGASGQAHRERRQHHNARAEGLGCLFGTTSFLTNRILESSSESVRGRRVCVIYQSSARTAEVRGRALTLKSGPYSSPGPGRQRNEYCCSTVYVGPARTQEASKVLGRVRPYHRFPFLFLLAALPEAPVPPPLAASLAEVAGSSPALVGRSRSDLPPWVERRRMVGRGGGGPPGCHLAAAQAADAAQTSGRAGDLPTAVQRHG